eukprot:TRINITY_DN4652_c0_g2_i1.p1 TRINITY_DN4652_c0_g2~~TRINITY_DN4652_c0_g2_i1.p1  ORF type:complete len:107 (+),score=3.74 TRINITY_DN4652_c0_g2_i1:241-561(+)
MKRTINFLPFFFLSFLFSFKMIAGFRTTAKLTLFFFFFKFFVCSPLALNSQRAQQNRGHEKEKRDLFLKKEKKNKKIEVIFTYTYGFFPFNILCLSHPPPFFFPFS